MPRREDFLAVMLGLESRFHDAERQGCFEWQVQEVRGLRRYRILLLKEVDRFRPTFL